MLCIHAGADGLIVSSYILWKVWSQLHPRLPGPCSERQELVHKMGRLTARRGAPSTAYSDTAGASPLPCIHIKQRKQVAFVFWVHKCVSLQVCRPLPLGEGTPPHGMRSRRTSAALMSRSGSVKHHRNSMNAEMHVDAALQPAQSQAPGLRKPSQGRACQSGQQLSQGRLCR